MSGRQQGSVTDYDPDVERDYLVWMTAGGYVFHVMPHGRTKDRANCVEWTREFAEDGMEGRPCRNGCFEPDGTLTAEARARVVGRREAERIGARLGEQLTAVRTAYDEHFGDGAE